MTDARTVDYPRNTWPGDRPEVPRPPGRVFFDPAGYDHLRGTLAAEVEELMSRPINGESAPLPRSGNPLIDDLDTILDELGDNIGNAGAVYGAPLATAIDDGRVHRARTGLRIIDGRLADTESAFASESSEVERLTRELARAQVAYDTACRTRDAHHLNIGELRKLLTTAIDDLTVQRALAEVFGEELRLALRHGRLSRDPRSVGSIIGAARRRAMKLAQSRRHPTQEDPDV